MSELPSSEDLDPSTGTDAPTPPTTTGPSSYTLNWEEPDWWPSEYSSGASRVQGSVTKTGNGHARRLLVEAAWHHRARYVVGTTMRQRWELAPVAARARGDEGNRRLHHRWVIFTERHKRHVIANVAIARKLAGWCWSLAVMDD